MRTSKKIASKQNISIIIPVHEMNDTVKPLYERSLESAIATDCNILVVSATNKINDELLTIKNAFNKNITYPIKNDEKTDFCSMVNFGVEHLDSSSDYFMILEMDDVINPQVFKQNIYSYMNAKKDYSVFIPLTYLFNSKGDKFEGFINELPLTPSFSKEIGCIDKDSLSDVFVFNLTGAVFSKEVWNRLGGLKSSIKVYFWYELMLRYTSHNVNFFVYPKVAYHHYLQRENSLFDTYVKTVSEKGNKFWLDVAKNNYTNNDDAFVYNNKD